MDVAQQTLVKPSAIPHIAYEDVQSVVLRPIPLLAESAWGESWQSLVLALKAERVRQEKKHPLAPGGPVVLTDRQENACRGAYSAIYAWQKWQDDIERTREANKGKAQEDRLPLPPAPNWVHDRIRSSLVAWNATFGPEGEPVPDPNDWNPRTYAADRLPLPETYSDPEDWGQV